MLNLSFTRFNYQKKSKTKTLNRKRLRISSSRIENDDDDDQIHKYSTQEVNLQQNSSNEESYDDNCNEHNEINLDHDEYSYDDSSSYNPSASDDENQESDENDFEVINELNNYGLTKYLQSRLGGRYTEKMLNYMVNITNNILQMTYLEHHNLQLRGSDTIQWFSQFITTDYMLLELYVDKYLISLKQQSPSTIINKLHYFNNIIKWFILYRDYNQEYFPVTYENCRCFFDLSASIRKYEKKKEKANRSGKDDINQLIYERKLPSGGLQELYNCCYDKMNWARSIIERPIKSIDKTIYIQFTQLLYSSIYVCAVQGRISGLHDMKYCQGDELLKKGFAMSRVFKTQSKYGFQPVAVAKESMELLKIYINHVRCAASHGNHVDPNEHLFLTYNGKAENDIGRHVTQFFLHHLKLNITTTKIRSLIETETEEKFQLNQISKAERESIMNINGHNPTTVKNHYIKRDRVRDVHNAAAALSTITNPTALDIDEVNIDNIIPAENDWINERPQYADWGKGHPNQNPDAKRVQWSKDELSYISNWIKKNKSTSASHCLKAIMTDTLCYEIFHINHILNSTRLRTGIERVVNK